MDEIDALRQMRTGLAVEEPPERLAARIDWRDGAGARPRPRSRRRLRIQLVSVAATAAVAAGTVAVVVSTGDGDPSGDPRVENTVPLNGNVLLVAATNAAKAPTGKYWHTRTVMGEIYAVGKSAEKHYKVDSRQGNETWTDRNGLSRNTHFDLQGLPVTPRDKQRWQAAGSPSWVHVPDPEGGGGQVDLDMSPQQGGEAPWPASVEKFYGMTPGQIAALPTEPKALEGVLLGLKGHWHAVSKDGEKEEPIRALRGQERVRALSDLAGELLSEQPAPPKVRAAVFRMLSGMPGVRPEGRTTDPLGRAGTAVSLPLKTTTPLGLFTAPKQLGTYRRQFIVDPATGSLLAIRDLVATPPHGSRPLPPGDDGRPRSLRAQDMPDRFHKPGEMAAYRAFEITEWTNTPPPR
ncbi:CU044_5270 family protein [Actinomadura sp. WMMA1423]|uniref:CU044_5270 family protein n=1 Tax=Actinomadura sp. WMMA1423 TaxID=2591108 RepID=UPI0011468985|nr:CU044_5270 family protein [Actinomadura sp. WMMA1423]